MIRRPRTPDQVRTEHHQDRRPALLTLSQFLLMLLVFLASAGTLEATSAAAAAPAVNQCNGTDNVGGQAVACNVRVVNNLDLATGLASSTVLVREYHDAANAAPTCITTATSYAVVTESVQQCNGSGSRGGEQ